MVSPNDYCRIASRKIYEIYNSKSPEIYLNAQLSWLKKYGREVLHIPSVYPLLSFGAGNWALPSAFGCEISPPTENRLAVIKKTLIKTPDEIPNLAKEIQIPNLRKAGNCPEALKLLEYYNKNVPEEIKVEQPFTAENFTYIGGVLDTAASILGMHNILVGIYKYPDALHQILNIIKDSIIEWIRIQEEIVGKIKKIVLTNHQIAFINPKYVKEFVIFYEQAVLKYWNGALKIFHGETDIRKNLGALAEFLKHCKIDVWHMSPQLDIGVAKNLFGDKVTLWGNIDTHEIAYGTPESIRKICKNIIMKAASGGGFILGTGGGLDTNGKFENLDAVIEAVKKYGKY